MSKRVTICDVAAKCGVSYQTVSRVLNGRIDLHKKATVRKVQEAAVELGYIARSENRKIRRSRASRSIGVVLDLTLDRCGLDFCRGVQAELIRRNYMPIILSFDSEIPAEELVGILSEREIEGIIIRPGSGNLSALEKAVKKSGFPVVSFDDPLSGIGVFDHIVSDDESGLQSGISFLLDEGHQRFAGIFTNGKIMVRRRRLFERVMAGFGESPQFLNIWDFEDDRANERMVMDLLQQESKPTALVVGGDFMFPAVCSAVTKLGYQMPNEISVLGFCEGITSCYPVSVLQQDGFNMGIQAVQLLISRIEASGRTLPPRELRFESRFEFNGAAPAFA